MLSYVWMPPAAKPSPPRNVTVEDVFSDSCVLRWKTPDSDGGAPVTGYVLEKTDADRKGAKWTRVGEMADEELSMKVEGLEAGRKYKFRVRAVNRIGQSDPAGPPEAVEAKDPWGNKNQLLKRNPCFSLTMSYLN